MLEQYLNKLQEDYVITDGDRLNCIICGRVVTVDESGKGPLVCCDKPMEKIGHILEAGFTNMPHGWTQKSVIKAGKTIAKDVGEKSPKDKSFFEKCVEKMRGKVQSPEGYCAALKDESYGSTYWRGKDKTKKEAQKDVAKHKNV